MNDFLVLEEMGMGMDGIGMDGMDRKIRVGFVGRV